jgi:hypothetical protein
MTAEVHPDIVMMLSGMQETMNAMRAELHEVRAELREKPAVPVEPRAAYSVAEAAVKFQKAEYTVRNWCREGRINATKRAERRGCSEVWSISAEEVTRYKNEGLLPQDMMRNG